MARIQTAIRRLTAQQEPRVVGHAGLGTLSGMVVPFMSRAELDAIEEAGANGSLDDDAQAQSRWRLDTEAVSRAWALFG